MRNKTLALFLVLWPVWARAAPPPEVLCARGIQQYNSGNLEKALPLLQQAHALQPELTAAGHHLGLTLIRLGRSEQGRRVLKATVRQDPANPRLLMDLGLAYLAEGNLPWAVRSLQAARDLSPDSATIRYHLGVALNRMRQAESAIDELNQASRLAGGPDGEDVQLQLGLAYYLHQQWSKSRQVLDPLLGTSRSSSAGQLLRATYEAEGVGASWISAELGTGAVVDTNPLYEHEMTAPTALGPRITGSLVLRPWVDAKTLIWGELAGARSFYFNSDSDSQTDAADASPSDLHAAAAYARRFSLAGHSAQLTASYALDLAFLDGSPPLADEHHIFLESHGGHLSLRWQRANGSATQIRYSLTRQAFADRPRTNWGNGLMAEYSRFLLANRIGLLSWLSLRYEAALSEDYDALSPGVGVGLSYLAPLDLVLGLRVGYEHDHYLHSSDSPRWGTKRLDHSLDLTLEVGRRLPWGMRLRAVYQRRDNLSSVESFDYDRNLVSLMLTWSHS